MNEWITDHTPPVETDVLIRCEYGNVAFVTIGMYEDGTVREGDSVYAWENLGALDPEYDAQRDQCLIPQRWWETTRFGDECIGNPIDCRVTGWMPTPEV